MTIKYLDSKRISALSSDTKPTNVETNSILVEKDTGKRYWNDGTAWTLESPVTLISGLKLWLDASDTTTITKDGSNLVSVWGDKSGEGNDLAQATGSSQPLWVDSVLNSKPIIRGDGVNDTITRATFTGGEESQINTILLVCKVGTTGTSDNKYVFDSGVTLKRHLLTNNTASNEYLLFASTIALIGTPDTNYNVFTLEFNNTSSILRRQKIQLGTGTVGTDALNGFTLFSAFDGGQSSNADIAEVLVYNKQLTTTDRDDIEQYLTAKWGL